MRRPRWRAAISIGLVGLLGCGPASDASSLSLTVDEAGALVGVHASTSADGAEIELDWAMAVDNRATSACPVAVYAWLPGAAGPDPSAALPSASAPEDWPDTWMDGQLIATGVAEPGARLTLGPTLLDEPAETIDGILGLATCPDARVQLGVRVEAAVDLGVRAFSDAFVLELWRLR